MPVFRVVENRMTKVHEKLKKPLRAKELMT